MPPRAFPRRLAGFTAVALLVLVAAAQVGRVPLLFDVLAVLQLHAAVLAIALGALALWRRWRGVAVAAGVAAAIGLAGTPALWSSPARPAAPDASQPITFATANVFRDNGARAALIPALLALDADVLVTQETTPDLLDPAGPLAAAYPHRRHWLPRGGAVHGPAIWSRWPLAPDAAGDRAGPHPRHLVATVEHPDGGRLQVMTLHLGRAPFGSQTWQLDDFNRFWRSMRRPLVVAGDFNAAPSSNTVRRVAAITRTEPLGGYRPTWHGGAAGLPVRLPHWLGLPIDHVLVSDDVGAEWVRTAELPGSDHLAVVARLLPPPPKRPVVE